MLDVYSFCCSKIKETEKRMSPVKLEGFNYSDFISGRSVVGVKEYSGKVIVTMAGVLNKTGDVYFWEELEITGTAKALKQITVKLLIGKK
jgi:hypothetical protein